MTDRAGRMRLATTVLLVAACRAGPTDVSPPPTEFADDEIWQFERRVVEVRDAESGLPLPAARVHTVRGPTPPSPLWWGRVEAVSEVVVATDAAGVAHVEFESGVSGIDFVEADGHVAAELWPVWPNDGSAIRVDLRAATAVEGRVLDDTGAPVAGARVHARRPMELKNVNRIVDCGDATTGADGSYRIATLPPDAQVLLRADTDGAAATVVELRTGVARNTTAGVVLRTARPVAVPGIVRAPDGTPVADASVIVTARSSADIDRFLRTTPFPLAWEIDPLIVATTSADGSFRIDGLASGSTYTAYVVGRHPRTYAQARFTADCGRLELTPVRFPRVFAHLVLPADDHDWRMREATAHIDGHGPYGGPVDDAGWTEIAAEYGGVGPGRRSIDVHVTPYFNASIDVETRMGEDVRVEIRLCDTRR